MVDLAYRDLVLVNEARSELKGSIAAWIGLVVVTAVTAFEFVGRAEPAAFRLWLGAMSCLLAAWLAAWGGFILRAPTDEVLLRRWIPGARLGMVLCNLVTAASVWVFMPVAEPELRALLLVLYAWFLIVQFAAATEATQVLNLAVALILGSLVAWLLVARPPHTGKFVLFLPLFGLTLIAVRRFVRQAVVKATQAQAAADASRLELAAALATLERQRDAKTQFIRAASHDLQQPLLAATLFLGQIKPSARQADHAAPLSGLRQSLGLARNLVDTMLQYLRMESGLLQPVLSHLTAGEVFDRVAVTQAPAAAGKVRLSFVGRSIPLHTDPDLLARAVENLVANAIRHSGGRRVLIGARARDGGVTIWVVDDGRGLGPTDAARIFQPFEQGASVGASGGFGLGLSSTTGLVEALAGACGVQPGLTRGAAFYITLPSHPGVSEARCAA